MGFRIVLLLFACSCFSLTAAQTTGLQPNVTTRLHEPSEDYVRGVIQAFDVAAPDDRFSLDLTFEYPTRLEKVRAAAEALGLQRVLADTGMSIPSIAMGTFYDGLPIWDYSVCRALVYSGFGGAALRGTPPEDWLVTKLIAYGSAYALRELMSGVHLPPAHITDGSIQKASRDARFRDAVRREVERTFETLPAGFQPPESCRPFLKLSDQPILTGPQPELSDEERGLGPAELLGRQLSRRAADDAVTLVLSFRQPLATTTLRRLVEDYQVDGLVAELVTPSTDRMIRIVELSVHGESLDDKVRRFDCAVAATAGAAGAPTWRSSSARVSLTVQKAWQLVDDLDIAEARLSAAFGPDELQRVERYFLDQAALPPSPVASGPIPRGCEAFLALEQ